VNQLVQFTRGDKVRIEVFAGEKAEAISPFLFGKFTENLGSNVYNGLWAQILRNTGFEPAEYFSHHGEGGIWRRMGHIGMLNVYPHLQNDMREGIACFWGKWGLGDVAYSLSEDCVNSNSAQMIEVNSLMSDEVGVLQPIWLPTHRTKEYEVSLWVKGTVKQAHVAIRTEDGATVGECTIPVSPEWSKQEAQISIDTGDFERGRPFLFTIALSEPGMVLLDQCFLFPTDHMNGFDPDVVRLLKESRLSMLRFPGGNFASGYHWKDGIGPIDARPIRLNPAWDLDEPNHVGTDEYITLCRMLGCEPLICVNAGNGTPEEAAQWVEYCNGTLDTEFGRLRARNGNPEPYGVKFWEVGNELYGEWQIGHCSSQEYAERYRRFHDAMKAVDPTINLIANGQDCAWNAAIIEKDKDILRSLSTHLLLGSAVPEDAEPEQVYLSYMALPFWFENELRAMGRQMEQGGVAEPKLAVTELQMFTKSPRLPNNQTLSEAIVYSGMVNAMIRTQGLVEIFTHSALVNHGGGILKQREFTFPNPVYWAHRIYASQPGRIPVQLRLTCPCFSVKQLHDLPGWEDVPYVDAIALLNEAGEKLNLIVTNRHPRKAMESQIYIHGMDASPHVIVKALTGRDFMTRNTFEVPDEVSPSLSQVDASGSSVVLVLPPHSITRLTFGK